MVHKFKKITFKISYAYYVVEQMEKHFKYTINKRSSLFLFILEQEVIGNQHKFQGYNVV